jgi:hypothetical protein
MIQDAGQRPPQLFCVRTDCMGAAFPVRKGDHTVDAGRQVLHPVAGRDLLGCMRRTITGCDYSDVVACTCAAVFTLIPKKRGDIYWSGSLDIPRWKFVVKRQLLESDIVGMHMLARLDCSARATHYLSVSHYALTSHDGPNRNLMTRGDVASDRERNSVDSKFVARRERDAGNSDVIGRMEMDGRVLGRGHFRNLEQAHL